MVADEMGGVWNVESTRISEPLKRVGKEMDRDKQKQKQEEQETSERDDDRVDLSGTEQAAPTPAVIVHRHNDKSVEPFAGTVIDVTVE